MAGPARAAGVPNYHSGGSIGFIPEVWSGNLAPKYYEACVAAAISNTNWEGEVKEVGDKVKIRVVPDINVGRYTVGGGVTYQKAQSNYIELNLDEAIQWGFEVNDVDEYQADINLMSNFSKDASEQMKIATDRIFLGADGPGFAGASDANISTYNKGATAGKISGNVDLGTTAAPEAITQATVIDYILRYGLVLDEQDIPEDGRWLVIPAWMSMLIKGSDLKDASLSGDKESIVRNGRIGMIDRFEIYKSNLLPHTASYTKVYAGHRESLTYAAQINKVENLKNPNDFGELVRGLAVFGYKVVNPAGVATGYAVKG
jgi:hypothetical protein